MPFFPDLSIKSKLTLIIMLTSSIVLILASAAFLTSDIVSFRRDTLEELSTLTEVIGNNCAAPLLFDDRQAALETLTALKADPQIVAAGLYREDGLLFASYTNASANETVLPQRLGDLKDLFPGSVGKTGTAVFEGEDFWDGGVGLLKPISLDSENVGAIFIQTDLKKLHRQLFWYLAIAAAIFLASSLVAFVLSFGLQRVISRPILNLAQTMRNVSREQDYTIRVRKESSDELGALIEGFNNMLEQIQLRDRKLKNGLAELREAKSMAEFANRSKTQFLSGMSHELRTPLNAIIGFTEILLDRHYGELNDTQTEYLRDVDASSNHLLALINDILDLSKVEAGKMELHLGKVDVRSLIDGSLFMIREKAMKHGIDLRIDTRGAPERLMADERKVKQVLVNLLSNAVKFTPDKGNIEILSAGVGRESLEKEIPPGFREEALSFLKENHDVYLKVSVKDTGKGIKPEALKEIFRPFQQEDNAISRVFAGTGLGLFLTKKLVELHHGAIWVESEVGQGSTFSFVLPFILYSEAPNLSDLPGSIRKQSA